MASAPDLIELKPTLELLSVPSDNLCLTSAMGMLVRAVKLAPLGITSAPFGTTAILELGWLESPSTTGSSRWLEILCLLTWLGLPDPPLGVV